MLEYLFRQPAGKLSDFGSFHAIMNLSMELSITKRQKDIIVGNILGDGGVYVNNWGHLPYYYIKQRKENKDYIFWLYKEFSQLCPSSPKQRKDNGQWYFYTSSSESFLPFRTAFYRNRRKVVPRDIDKLLTSPLSLAVWYMDDGHLDYREKYHCSFNLMINSFTLDEAAMLSKVLKKNFGVIATIQNPLCRGKRHPRLYIGVSGRERFLTLIQPYIHQCFAYKLPQNRISPSETDSVPPWCGRDRRYLPSRK